jgi:hypothetical protein
MPLTTLVGVDGVDDNCWGTVVWLSLFGLSPDSFFHNICQVKPFLAINLDTIRPRIAVFFFLKPY